MNKEKVLGNLLKIKENDYIHGYYDGAITQVIKIKNGKVTEKILRNDDFNETVGKQFTCEYNLENYSDYFREVITEAEDKASIETKE